MLLGRILHTEEGRQNISLARNLLISRFGLVLPFAGYGNEKDVLVWEDGTGVGRYRVHFEPHTRRGETFYDSIQFTYWANRARAKREIFIADPMNQAVNAVKGVLVGNIIEEPLGDDASAEEILSFIFRKKSH